MSFLSSSSGAAAAAAFAGYEPHWARYPRTYVAPRVPLGSITTEQLDGNLNKHPWNNDTLVPWSDAFGDIQGWPMPVGSDDDGSIPLTRFKAVWDDQHLYIAASLAATSWLTTEVHFAQRNSPIYQMDSDFEVFVDAPGQNHNYKELEINAINTVWNLLLDKPYGDGGQEHSGRVAEPGEPLYWDVSHQRTATCVVDGLLNDPSGRGALWTVELALAFEDLHDRSGGPLSAVPLPFPPGGARNQPPRPTTTQYYRINFSRVEASGDINWTWQPQIVWDPKRRKHQGKINMHLPDAWGYLVLGDDAASRSSDTTTPDVTWPHRLAAMNVYYAQRYHKEVHRVYTAQLEDLTVDSEIVAPFDIRIVTGINDDDGSETFLVTVRGTLDDIVVTVRHDRLLTVLPTLEEDKNLEATDRDRIP